MVMITTTKKTDQIPDCRPCLGVHQLLPQSNLICKDVAQLPMWILPGIFYLSPDHIYQCLESSFILSMKKQYSGK